MAESEAASVASRLRAPSGHGCPQRTRAQDVLERATGIARGSPNSTGVAGFEPTHGGVKVRCLTAWLHPNALRASGTPFVLTALRRFATARPHGHSPWVPRFASRDYRPQSRALVKLEAGIAPDYRRVAMRRFAPM
jgi:hypothetical protein